MLLAIAGGIVLAFWIIRLIVRRDLRKGQREAKLGELVAKFLTSPAAAESVLHDHDLLLDQFTAWLSTKNGAAALIAANYHLAQ